VKWRQWKMHLVLEPEPNVGPIRLETPWIFNLIQDPRGERYGNQGCKLGAAGR